MLVSQNLSILDKLYKLYMAVNVDVSLLQF